MSHMARTFSIVLLVVVGCHWRLARQCTGAQAASGARTDDGNWPQWRGPHHNGVSDATGVPTTWSETENIAWKVPLPSWSGATPIVWGDRVFVMSPSKPTADAKGVGVARRLPGVGRERPGGPDILLLCFGRKDGKLLWQRRLASDNTLYGKQNMASPSPVTDGKLVWALTGTGALAAFDFSGKEVWRHNLQDEYGQFGLNWGYASSPLLYDGMLIVQVLHGSRTQNQSYVVAFDSPTGKVVWKVERKTDATRECPDAYTTPVVSKHAGRTDLVILGADYVTGHDPKTGREIWRAGGLNPQRRGNYRIVASPVAMGGFIYAPTRVRPLLALRAGGRGDVTTSNLAWRFDDKVGPDVPTPVCDGKHLYLVNDRGYASCLDAKTGEVVWGPQRTAPGTVSASPVLADGRIYITNETATTTVLAIGPQFKILHTNQLDDGYTLATPTFAGLQIFIRTSTHLYCIAGKRRNVETLKP